MKDKPLSIILMDGTERFFRTGAELAEYYNNRSDARKTPKTTSKKEENKNDKV